MHRLSQSTLGNSGDSTKPVELRTELLSTSCDSRLHPCVLQLSSNGYSSCAVTSAMKVVCWDTPTSPPADGLEAVAVAVGWLHTCSLSQAGNVSCWGSNSLNQLDMPALLRVALIAAGSDHTCVVLAHPGKAVRCWGDNSAGQLHVPDGFTMGLANIVAIYSLSTQTCVITDTAKVTCWGGGLEFKSDFVPPEFGADGQVVALAAGWTSWCAQSSEGHVACWGIDTTGQTIVPTDLGRVKAIGSGLFHVCAVKVNGVMVCWGLKEAVQTVPAKVRNPMQIVGGRLHTCIVTRTGMVRCWGKRYDKQRPSLLSDLCVPGESCAVARQSDSFAVTTRPLQPPLFLVAAEAVQQ